MALAVSDSLEALTSDWTAVPYSDASDRFVLGDVRLDARIILIGEAPGEEEDQSGRAFTGRAGRKLDDSLRQVGLDRSRVSIGNVMPRRPRANRDPKDDEIKANSPYVQRLIDLHPNVKAVALMGNAALKWKTGRTKISAFRGCEFRDSDLWWLPLLHPANALYKPSEGKWLISDLRWLKSLSEGNLLDLSGMEFTAIDDGANLVSFVPEIVASPVSYLDIETGAHPPVKAFWWWDPRVSVILVSFAWVHDGEFHAIVVEANDSTVPVIRDLLAAAPRHWGGAGALYFDFPMLRRLGMPPVCQQTMLDSYPIAKLNDENRGCGLKSLGRQHLRTVGYEPYWGEDEEEEWQGQWHRWPEMSPEERHERVNYSGKDAWVGIQTLLIEAKALRAKPNLVKAYRDLVLHQAEAIEEMRLEGMPFDRPLAVERAAAIETEMKELSAALCRVIPDEVKATKQRKRRKKDTEDPPVEVVEPNIGSAPQVARLVFKVGGLPAVKPTPKQDRASADKFALLKSMDLEGQPEYPAWAFEVIRGRLHYKKLEKAKGYIDSLIEAADLSHDGRIHSNFKIGPVTWRIASADPNLQQLSGKQHEDPRKDLMNIKGLFAAPEGWSLVKHDFSGLEVNGLADQSGDSKLISRILRGEDLHWRHTCGVMGWDYDSVEKDGDGKPIMPSPFHKQCRLCFKTSFFASGYGVGENKLADTLRDELYQAGVGRDVVLAILQALNVNPGKDMYLALARFWLRWLNTEYPGLKDSFKRFAAETGRSMFVTGKFGIERHLPEIRDYDDNIRAEAERQAFNFVPQNLSCLTFLSYRELATIRRDMELDAEIRLVLQEHDSNLWLVRSEHAPLWDAMCRQVMEHPDWDEWGATFAVPLKVEGSIAQRWS